jgi:flagellar hook-length control protein FliK
MMTLSFLTLQKPGPTGASGIDVRAPSEALAGAGSGFAARLQEQMQPPAPEAMLQAAPPPPPRDNNGPAARDGSEQATSPDDEAQQVRRRMAAPRPRQPSVAGPRAEEAAPEQRGAGARLAGPAEATASDPQDAATEGAPAARNDDDAAADTALTANWMMQMLAVRPQADAQGAAAQAGAGEAADTALPHGGKGRPGPAGQAGDATTGQALLAGAERQLAAQETQQAWQAESAEALAAAGPAGALPRAVLPEAAAAQLAALAQAAGSAAAPSAQVQVTLDTPVHQSGFRDALAAQVSTFARDGIHEAVLKLNPADMGPITVQIAMDGTQARIDFQATQPATRELIEGSLPSLASALHGEGLTLSGGSVGDQRAPGQDPGAPRPGRDMHHAGMAAAGADAAVPAMAAAPRSDRALDVYA